jgi:hypothetical protein
MNKNEEIAKQVKEEMKEQFKDESGKYPNKLKKELAEEIVKDIEDQPRFWLRKKVEKLIEDGYPYMGIIAANTFAEAVCDLYIGNINDIRERRNMVSSRERYYLEEKCGYKPKLEFLEDLGPLEGVLLDHLKKLKNSRNDLNHELSSHSPEKELEIEKHLGIEKIPNLLDDLRNELSNEFGVWMESTFLDGELENSEVHY